jgi:hypothetical protein
MPTPPLKFKRPAQRSRLLKPAVLTEQNVMTTAKNFDILYWGDCTITDDVIIFRCHFYLY